jgi:hypothetical protein
VFKEFGIRLNFTPTVTGDRVHLKVRPEVSTLDFANGVSLQGFRIPALTTRRTETELELQNGQTFAIAGLMNNTMSSTMSKVPGIGDIPILGLLFRSKAANKNQTELVVMITPHILANNSSGVTTTLPRGPETFIQPLPEKQLKPLPPPAFTSPRQGATAAPATVPGTPAAAPATSAAAPTPKAAAAKVSSLAPAAPRVIAPAAAAPAAAAKPAPPLSGKDKRELDRAQREAQERARVQEKVDQRTKAEDTKKQTAQILADRHKADAERVRQERLSREQARRDGEAARRAQEEARRQAEKDRVQQKSIEEAAARLKAAEALYQAELAKKNNP